MKFTELLFPESVINNAHADSKKSVLELISKLIAQNLTNIKYEQIFESLVSREKLGSTGIGHGVAIPHGRIKTLPKPIAVFVRLQDAVDFEANDNQPVDLFFALLVPEQDENKYLEILSEIAERFSHEEFRKRLRKAKDDRELYEILGSS
jgi:PTS system nitrogen regulatory IIA component